MTRSRKAAGALLIALLGAGCTGVIGDAGKGSRPDPSDPDDPDDPGKVGPPGGGGSGPPIEIEPGGCAIATPTPPRLWRLTRSQFKNTVVDTFGFAVPELDNLPDEARLDGFTNAAERLGVSTVLFEYMNRIAEAVGNEVVKRGADFVGCPLAQLGTGNCLGDFLGKFGTRAWRRPLTEADLGRLTKLYQAAANGNGTTGSPELGLATVVQGLVLSANFLFRTEIGASETPAASTTLTDVELASALSYLLWDAPPDAALLDLALANRLHEPATLAAETKRLLATSTKAPAALHSFVRQWLETEDLAEKPKDPMTFPGFDREMAKQLEEETALFVDEVMFAPGGDRSVRTLLTAKHGFVSAKTAPIYGATGAGATLAKMELDPVQRRGLLTQGSFLAAHAEPINTSVVGRGRYIREEILCDDVPPPPGEFKFNEKVITEDMTAREKFTEHAKNPACASCHALFDTIGFALENYDAIGQWRKTEKGKTIDPSGKLSLPSGAELEFANFVDLIDQLGKSTDAYACFSAQYLTYASGRVKLDACEQKTMAAKFAASGYRLDALISAIISSPSFVTRRN